MTDDSSENGGAPPTDDPSDEGAGRGTETDAHDTPFDELAPADGGGDPFVELGDADDELFEDVGVTSVEEMLATEGDAARDPPSGDFTAVVPKRHYCQDCTHFDRPPAARCTHPDGEILTLVDMEHFEVRNCPVVEGRFESGLLDENTVSIERLEPTDPATGVASTAGADGESSPADDAEPSVSPEEDA